MVLPVYVSWGEGGLDAVPAARRPPRQADPKSVKEVAQALRSDESKVVMILGTLAVVADLHPLLAGIAAAIGAYGQFEISNIPGGPTPARLGSRSMYTGRPSLLHRPNDDVLVLSREDKRPRAC
jgi:acetolactate synthase-1/2/3 large subunit